MNVSNRVKQLVMALLCVAFGACGGSDGGVTQTCPAGTTGTPPNCTPIPPPCTQDVLESGSGPWTPRTLVRDDFSVPDTGRLDITVDWTNASSPIGVYMAPANTCALADFNARTCEFVVRSEPSPQKPRKISTPNFAAGNYRWLIANFSDSDESISFQFVLSKGTGCPALTGAPPAALSRDGGEPLQVERSVPR